MQSIHMYVTDRDGRHSYTYDEEEFNDGSVTLTEVVDQLIAEGATKIEIEVNI